MPFSYTLQEAFVGWTGPPVRAFSFMMIQSNVWLYCNVSARTAKPSTLRTP